MRFFKTKRKLQAIALVLVVAFVVQTFVKGPVVSFGQEVRKSLVTNDGVTVPGVTYTLTLHTASSGEYAWHSASATGLPERVVAQMCFTHEIYVERPGQIPSWISGKSSLSLSDGSHCALYSQNDPYVTQYRNIGDFKLVELRVDIQWFRDNGSLLQKTRATNVGPFTSGNIYTGTYTWTAPTAPSISGKTFVGWSSNKTEYVPFPESGCASIPPANAYAFYREAGAEVSFDSNGAVGEPPANMAIKPGESYTFPNAGNLTKSGYSFVGWGEDANSYLNGDTVYKTGQALTLADPDNDKTFYAQWAKSYSVTYDMNGGTSSPPSPGTAVSAPDGNASLTVDNTSNFTKPGYRFEGWSANQNATAADVAPGSLLTVTNDMTLYAVWKPLNEWTVTYTGDTTGVTGDFPVESGGPYYDDGSTHTITVKNNTQTRPGYSFLGWSTTAGSQAADPAYAPGKTFTLTGDITLYSVWAKNDYNITFDGNGYDSGTVPGIISPAYGDTVTLPDSDLKKRGFVFDGWSNSATGALDYPKGSTLTISSSASNPRTLYAHWKAADSYTLTYDKNAGSDTVTGSLPGTTSYTADGITNVLNVTNVVPVRAGYSFLGWSTTPNGNVEYAAGAPITLTKNTTLYAKWDMGSFSLTYHFNGDSDAMIGNKPATVTGDPTTTGITVAGQGTMAREYHKFMGWKDDTGKAYNVGDPVTLTSNINLYAQWKDLRNVDPGTGKTGEATLYYNNNVTSGSIVTNMPADEGGHYDDNVHNMATISSLKPVRVGYEFKGWSENAGESPSSTALLQGGAQLSVITDKTLYAIWELKNYELTYDANIPSGDSNPVTGAFPSGSVQGNVTTSINTDNATGFSRNHYTFKEWNTQANGKGTSYAAGTVITISADTTLYAIWEPVTYTVTYDAGGAGGTPPTAQTGKYGASFVAEQPTNLTNPGKSFAGWKDGNGKTYSPGASYPYERNLKLTAQWSTDIWTIQYNIASAEQGAAIADAKATLGDTVVLPMGANLRKSRFVFKGWNTAPDGVSGTAYAKGGNFTIAQSTAKTTILYASWDAATAYRVTYHKNASDATGTEPPTATCYNDGLAESTVIPADSLTRKGYTFLGWSTSSAAGASVEYRAGDTVEPVAAGKSIDLYAVWGIDAFTLTYDKGNPGAIGTAPAAVTGNATSNITAEPQGSLYLAHHKFVGWNTEADYSGAKIKPGDKIVLNENKTLYAEWTPVSPMGVTYYSGCTDPAVDATLPVDTNQYYDDGINSRATISTMKPLRPGYDFLYWTTQPNGAGKQYNGGETVTMTGDLKLYAAWDMGSYTLTYDPGESPSEVQGSMPASKFGNLLSKITVEDDTGFSRPYYTFSGWNTAKDGAGTTYQPGDKISLGMDTVLYAQWKETTYKVKYDLNSPLISTATGTIPSAISGTYQDKFRAAPQGDIICPKYRFMGWDTDPDGVGDRFDPGREYSFGVFEDYGDDITLYAVWEAVPPYEIVYDKNSTKVTGSVPVDKNLYTVDDGNNLATVLGPGSLKWKGYEFVCWSTKKNGSGSKYVEGSQFRVTAHTKLYAQWTPGTYTLTYDKNGSEVKGKVPASIRKSSQEDIAAAGKGTLTRKNYEFLGWATKSTATSPTYKAGAKFRILEDTKLYAVWRKLVNVSIEETEGLVPGSSVAIQQVSPGTKLSEIKLPQVKSGYEITGWIVNGETVTDPKNYTITKDSDVQPIVKKKPEKKPDDKKPDNNKPDDKKPDNNKPNNNKPGGNNPGGGQNSGTNPGGTGGTGGNGFGNSSGSRSFEAGVATSQGQAKGSSLLANDNYSNGYNNGYNEGYNEGYNKGIADYSDSQTGTGSGGGAEEHKSTSGYGPISECFIHWLILAGILLNALYAFLRGRRIRSKHILGSDFFADMLIPMLSIPLCVLAYEFRMCVLDLYFILAWIVVTIFTFWHIHRQFQKNAKEIEQEWRPLPNAEIASARADAGTAADTVRQNQ